MISTVLRKLCAVVSAFSVLSGVFVLLFSGQAPVTDIPLGNVNRAALMQQFTPLEAGEKAPLRRVIDSEHPLVMVNYYGGETVTERWLSVPANQRPYCALLIIPGHPLLSGRSPDFLINAAEACEANQIPYIIQNITGETQMEERLPVAYLEKEFAQKHRYFYGLSAAELYNGVSWRGETESNHSQYVIDCVNLAARYGAFFVWTDTNMNYRSGMIIEWLETNPSLYSAFKNNAENVVMMYKESFGNPSSYSVMQGLWLAGLAGNWGVSSDWWHWQVDGDKKSLFGEYDAFVDNEWDSIINFPENMFAQSMALTMSCGGTCFLWEAPVFSMAVYGNPVAGYEYAISPLLDAVIAGEIKIPSREQVLAETKAVVLGYENYSEFNYNLDESNLYPATGAARILPLLPNNLRWAERAVFESRGITLVREKQGKAYYENLYGQAVRGNTYAVKTADQWFYINNVENARAVKSAWMTLSPNAGFGIRAQEHTCAVVKQTAGGLGFYLSNYRTDKGNMIKSFTPAYFESVGLTAFLGNFLTLDAHGNPKGVDDTQKRTTAVTVKTGGVEPRVVWLSSPDGSGKSNRPFTYSSAWDGETLTLQIEHNGVVKFKVLFDVPPPAARPAQQAEVSACTMPPPACGRTTRLRNLIGSLAVKDKSCYNEYSYLQFSAALENAKVLIDEGETSVFQLAAAEFRLACAYGNLLDITRYTGLLKDLLNADASGAAAPAREAFYAAYDALLREALSNTVYVEGRSSRLEYSEMYRKSPFSKTLKQQALERKYDDLMQAAENVGL